MEINNQPSEYDLKFEDGQMLKINITILFDTVYETKPTLHVCEKTTCEVSKSFLTT